MTDHHDSWFLGFSLYTPNHLHSDRPTKIDGRPYSSLILIGGSEIRVDGSSTEAIKQEVQLGVLGLPVGGKIQRAAHKIFGGDEPMGWGSEISRGGEPTFLYALQNRLRLCPGDGNTSACGDSSFDLRANWGTTFGYYTTLQGSIAGRFGRINSPFWVDYGPIHLHTSQAKAQVTEKAGRRELYTFVAGGVDVVFYNALLQGQFRANAYEVASSDVTRLVPYFTVGVVVSFGRCQLTMSHNVRGPEVEGGKNHRWNSISVGFSEPPRVSRRLYS